jgi:hypothetical protein
MKYFPNRGFALQYQLQYQRARMSAISANQRNISMPFSVRAAAYFFAASAAFLIDFAITGPSGAPGI